MDDALFFIFLFFLATVSPGNAKTYPPGQWNDEVPHLENPFSVAYLKENLPKKWGQVDILTVRFQTAT